MTRRKVVAKTVKKEGIDEEDVEVARSALFAAVEGDDDDLLMSPLNSPAGLLRLFVSSNTSKSIIPGISARVQKNLLMEAVKTMNKGQGRRFFAGLKTIVDKAISEKDYIPESAFEDEDGDFSNQETEYVEVLPDSESSEALNFLRIAAECIQAYLGGLVDKHSNKKTQMPVIGEAYDVALSLHNILLELNCCGPDATAVQLAIVSFCETWWHANGIQREQLVLQVLPLLVSAALGDGPSSQTSDIKRLFQMRQALEVIDFADPSSDSLRSLLKSIAASPCLKFPEGKRFFAYLFHVDAILLKDVHQAIRALIPEEKKATLEAYGEIYFRAWMEAPTSEIQETIESEVLSDLMYAVIHVADQNMNKSLLTVLDPLHDAKKNPQVEGLLHRMYGPILWRSLGAANAIVRVNATQVLVEVFPLQEASHTQTGPAISKGCKALRALLQDSDPRVRVAGSGAMAKILSTYWDILPAAEIRALLNHIVAEHASDASSSAVRAGALNAVTLLLKDPQSHAVLRALLPSLGNLIHDKVEKVRLAAARLLLCIKTIPGIKYYHVVPVDHLTARMADEGRRNATGPVASALTALMLNSFFPQSPSVSGVDKIRRTIKFLTNDPAAAAVFCANLSDHLPVSAIAQLAAMLLRCLHSAVETAQKRKTMEKAKGHKRRCYGKQQDDDSDDEEEDGSDTLLSASDTALMANVAETICTLWQSIEAELNEAENEECNKFLVEAFSGTTLTNALNYFEQKAMDCESDDDDSVREDCYRTCAAILRSAGWLPSKAVEGLVSHISEILASLSETDSPDSPRQNVSAHIALLCLWDMTDEVAPSLAASIESIFEEDHELGFGSPTSNSKKRRSGVSRRKTSGVAVPVLPASVALDVLGDILRGSDPSSVAARESILGSKIACSSIEKALERGTKYAERILSGEALFSEALQDTKVDFVLRVCEAFGRFALHKEAISSHGNVKFSPEAHRLLQWTTNKVVPAFALTTEEGAPFNDPNLSRISIDKSFSTSLPLSPVPTGPARRRANRNKTPARLDEGLGSSFGIAQGTRNESSVLVARAFAVSLMQSSCVIFSEWLAVGGSGSQEIAKSGAEWCAIFQNEENGAETQDELSPAFTRLAMQLCKTAQDFSMLKQLLICCHEKDDGDGMPAIRQTLTSLLSTRGNLSAAMVENTVESLVGAAHELVEQKKVIMTPELPTSMGAFWPAHVGCIVSGLNAIFASRPASIELAKQIVEQFSRHAERSLKTALFNTKCLWMLCDSEDSKATADVAKIVRRLDVEGLESESSLRPLVEDILECVGTAE